MSNQDHFPKPNFNTTDPVTTKSESHVQISKMFTNMFQFKSSSFHFFLWFSIFMLL